MFYPFNANNGVAMITYLMFYLSAEPLVAKILIVNSSTTCFKLYKFSSFSELSLD